MTKLQMHVEPVM